MMGHINNMVVQMVRENLGEEGVTKLFAEAGLRPTKYQPEMIYPEPEFQALFRGARVGAGLGQTQQGHPGLVGMVVQPRQSEHLGVIAEAVLEPADIQRHHPAESEPEHATFVIGSVDMGQLAVG